jgi:hypothetical protein
MNTDYMAERVRSDPLQASWPGQGRSRRGEEAQGFIHEALEEEDDEGMIGSWNDYFGVGIKTPCGLLYLNENFGILGIGASYH